MTTYPEALRLAQALRDGVPYDEAEIENELRRLYEAHEWQYKMAEERLRRIEKLEAQRGALLEALRTLLSYANVLEMRLLDADGEHRAMQKARAAIAKAEGEGA